MTSIAIVGATGYAGAEIAALLEHHPVVESLAFYRGREDSERAPADPLGLRWIEPLDLDALGRDFDVVFVCLPHGAGHRVTLAALEGPAAPRVIDLSADFRFPDAAQYEAVYGVEHPSPELCNAAVYGLTEHRRAEIAGARLVANPGCYPTASLLALLPLVKAGVMRSGSRVVIDAKSGVSGAGRAATPTTLYGNVNENVRAYGVGTHRHGPEIQLLVDGELADSGAAAGSVGVVFIPHLLPMFRGMLATLYVEPASGVSVNSAREVLMEAYRDEPFVHLVDAQAQTAHVARTNHCHLSVEAAGDVLVVTSAIDNLMKGAAGAAVQNMNVMLGLEESAGLLSAVLTRP
ncbi:MAG: N-acetyl-gamma-glutamyl-phosphate reductase [Planctomycetota bacterium]